MAVKKTELYSMLWEACNKLRGGVEPARYKDYVLVLLFFKYVSDRYKGQPFAEFTVSKGASLKTSLLQKEKAMSESASIKLSKSFWRITDFKDRFQRLVLIIQKNWVLGRN